jgi:hypothetical protein
MKLSRLGYECLIAAKIKDAIHGTQQRPPIIMLFLSPTFSITLVEVILPIARVNEMIAFEYYPNLSKPSSSNS